MPGAIAEITELVVAPRARDLLVALLLALGFAVVDREVEATLGGQAGNVMRVCGEEVFSECLLITASIRNSSL